VGEERPPGVGEAVEQRDAADEGWLEPCGKAIVGSVIVLEGKVVHPSQLIASVRRTSRWVAETVREEARRAA
jgi:hypothetical protein